MLFVTNINHSIVQVRRRSTAQQQSHDVQRTFFVISNQVRSSRRIQVRSNVFAASCPNGWVKKKKTTWPRVVSKEENVAFDENLKVLELGEFEDEKLWKGKFIYFLNF